MQFQRNTSIGKSSNTLRILIKISAVIFFLFLLIILVDKVDFPSPIKKIEKIISNENFKIVK
tara:strand:+ start:425 stop:610 length:186 start_codon:yes stop_codon:yes gene_type:complete